jgi:hypothetical protein
VLDVNPNGQTLTVSSIGMNSTAQNVGTEYANGPQAQTIFSFQIDGPSLKVLTQGLRTELNNAIATATNKKDVTRLKEAIANLDVILNPGPWTADGNHLVCNGGPKAFDSYRTAIIQLMAMLQETTPGISDATVQQWINVLININRNLAQHAIDESNDAGAISDALGEWAKGDSDVSHGDYDKAITHYKAAWKKVRGCV